MVGTRDAIKRFWIPDAPSAESGDIVLALSKRLLPLTINKLAKGGNSRLSGEALEAVRETAFAKVLEGRFASVKHIFTALEAGTASTSALFGTRSW